MAAGYDISASRAESIAQAAHLTTPTIINFGEKGYVDGGWYGQTTEQAPTATAARNAGDTAGSTSGKGLSAAISGIPQEWLLIGGIAVVGIVVVFVMNKKKIV